MIWNISENVNLRAEGSLYYPWNELDYLRRQRHEDIPKEQLLRMTLPFTSKWWHHVKLPKTMQSPKQMISMSYSFSTIYVSSPFIRSVNAI